MSPGYKDRRSVEINQRAFSTILIHWSSFIPMAIASDLLELVPIGEENAAPGLLLWKQLDMWSPAGIKHNLQEMADKGVIERKRVRCGPHETNLYFRSRKSEQCRASSS
jgi:hypothetical protein